MSPQIRVVLLIVATLVSTSTRVADAEQRAATPGLTIVVIAGEDAVNVVQQKTAVQPVIEVRDRNDQPVAGAVVRFAVRSGRAAFGGGQTLTVTTDAAGRAVVTGLSPTGTGTVQIGATATFQGQTATVTIAQTNVLTAAQAAAAGVATTGASAAGTAGATAGSGAAAGGISATTIGVIGGAVAGGTIAAKQLTGGGDHPYEGSFSLTTLYTFRNTKGGAPTFSCDITLTISGTIQVEGEDTGGGNISAHLFSSWTIAEGARTCPAGSGPETTEQVGTDYSGPQTSLNFTATYNGPGGNPPNVGTIINTFTLTGDRNGNMINGTVTLMKTFTATIAATGELHVDNYGPASVPVTLTQQ